MYTTKNLKIYIINVNIDYTESYLIVIKLPHHNDNGNTIKT